MTTDAPAGAILLYGAYGYTGELIARLAVSRGESLILAGRDEGRVSALATSLGLPWRAFGLEAAATHLDGVAVVLHAAGPFIRTSAPMLKACLSAGVHYLDITGEIAVFEACAHRDAAARSASIMVMPGVGFDVVPTDCLAAHVHNALPGATALSLAFMSLGEMSHGTSSTVVMNLGEGGAVRKDGKIIRVPLAHQTRAVDFGRGPRATVTVPWGDVSTAFYATGIGDIAVYYALPKGARIAARLSNYVGPLLRQPWLKRALQRRIDAATAGPDASARARSASLLWAEARAPDGRVATARMVTPDGYDFTADAALRIALRARDGDVRVGFSTPSMAYGADFVLSCDGVERTDAVVTIA